MTPREVLPALDGPWRLRRVDDAPVWAITCFYVRKGQRHQGVSAAPPCLASPVSTGFAKRVIVKSRVIVAAH